MKAEVCVKDDQRDRPVCISLLVSFSTVPVYMQDLHFRIKTNLSFQSNVKFLYSQSSKSNNKPLRL